MENKILIYSGIIVLIILIGAYSLISNKNTEDKNVREIRINAQRFNFSPENIEVNQEEKIRLVINNIDATHGIKIPELNLAGNNIIEFTADKKGTFQFYCNNYCGESHSSMGGKIIIK